MNNNTLYYIVGLMEVLSVCAEYICQVYKINYRLTGLPVAGSVATIKRNPFNCRDLALGSVV